MTAQELRLVLVHVIEGWKVLSSWILKPVLRRPCCHALAFHEVDLKAPPGFPRCVFEAHVLDRAVDEHDVTGIHLDTGHFRPQFLELAGKYVITSMIEGKYGTNRNAVWIEIG
jgi:hypothetical protein